MATRQQLRKWFDSGVELNYPWMLIVSGPSGDQPVYVMTRMQAERIVATSGSVTEIYNLRAKRGPQLDADRVWALRDNDPAIRFDPKPAHTQPSKVVRGLQTPQMAVAEMLNKPKTVDTVRPYAGRQEAPSWSEFNQLQHRVRKLEKTLAALKGVLPS